MVGPSQEYLLLCLEATLGLGPSGFWVGVGGRLSLGPFGIVYLASVHMYAWMSLSLV